jgi:hypothetical protein
MANPSTPRPPRRTAASALTGEGAQGQSSSLESAVTDGVPADPIEGGEVAPVEGSGQVTIQAFPPPPPPALDEGPPVLAETKLGPETPELPPEPPPPVAQVVTGASFPDEAPSAPRELIQLPLLGALLRCDNFTEIGEGIAVQAEVMDHDEAEGSVMVWIAAYNRRWPVMHNRIKGDKWVHHASDYPPAGEHPRFDMKFRQRAAHVKDAPAPVKVEAKRYQPVRVARPGYTWVEIVDEGGVAAIGFNLAGESRRDWKKGDKAEISLGAVRGSPTLFKML